MARRPQISPSDAVPPTPVRAFPGRSIQASSLSARMAKAISVALRECGRPRDVVAETMSSYLGRKVSKPMLDAYASEAREDHAISAERFAALLHATQDRRLLEMLAEPQGWVVIERRYLPLLDLAAVQARTAELHRQSDALLRQARDGGLLT